MDQFLTYIERYKFAILGTVLFHVFFFMYTNFMTVQQPYSIAFEEDVAEITLESDEIELDEKMMEMLERNNQLNNEQLYNVVSDANDTREKSYENFSTQDIDEEVENDARELERQYFEEWASTHPDESSAASESGSNESTNAENQNNKNQRNESSSVDNSGSNAFAGQVMVSFDLDDRKAHSLDIPGYTCRGSGTVVIEVKVDKNGTVRNAEYNGALSSGATECMIQKAKRYAKKARFDYKSTAQNPQTGIITYKFQGQ